MRRRIELLRSEVLRSGGTLESLSPDAVLGRGYSITTRVKDGRIVSRSADLEAEDEIHVRFHAGSVRGLVKAVEEG